MLFVLISIVNKTILILTHNIRDGREAVDLLCYTPTVLELCLHFSLLVCSLSTLFFLGRMRPKIDIYPNVTQTIVVGGSALFQCRVMDGDPPPTIRWSRYKKL